MTELGVAAPAAVAAGGARAFTRDLALVARFELAESLRSRLLAVMLLLFVGAGALGAYSFSRFVAAVEERAAEVLRAPSSKRPGGAMRRLRESQSYRDIVRVFVRDERKAEYFAALPPIVVFYAFTAFLFTPWLILFTSAETIASEVASRQIRYSLLRTSRIVYAVGKALGQLLILIGVTGVAALVFYAIAWIELAGFEAGATALALVSYWPRIVLYTLPFLAWAMFASMLTASTNLARVVSLGGGVGLFILQGVAGADDWRRNAVAAAGLDLLGMLTPFGHAEGLRYPQGGALPADLAICLGLTVLYFAAGFFILHRRDV